MALHLARILPSYFRTQPEDRRNKESLCSDPEKKKSGMCAWLAEYVHRNNERSVPAFLEKRFSNSYEFCGKVIGEGKFGIVRLARGKDSHDMYAVKVFKKKKGSCSEEDHNKRLILEFYIGSLLRHPNVVQIHDIVKDGNKWYEVMEYCRGGDLLTHIKDGNLNEKMINTHFKQLVSGVLYLHDLGVAHRDLKPENILLDLDGHLKITDFGVSNIFRTQCVSRGVRGSAPYMAPEIFEQETYNPFPVDIWACAIIYCAMLFKGTPWYTASQEDKNYLSYCADGGASLLSELGDEQRELLGRMLEPDPEKRITAKEIVENSWFSTIQDEPLWE